MKFGCSDGHSKTGKVMAEVHTEIACHTPQAGLYAIRLHGGPWDGKDVGVRNPDPSYIKVNGPRHGRHSVWITHLYQRRGGRYEFAGTEVVPLSASRIDLMSVDDQEG
jgi:hypothetical protein